MEEVTQDRPSQDEADASETLIAVYGQFHVRAPLIRRNDALVPRRRYRLYLVNDEGDQLLSTTHSSNRANIISELQEQLYYRQEKIRWHNVLLADIREDDPQQQGYTAELHGRRDLVEQMEGDYRKLLVALAEVEIEGRLD